MRKIAYAAAVAATGGVMVLAPVASASAAPAHHAVQTASSHHAAQTGSKTEAWY